MGSRRSRAWFTTTHWSVVLSAHGQDSATARASLENIVSSPDQIAEERRHLLQALS
jgi:hypothetical protein